MWKITWNKRVDKALGQIPTYIQEKFRAWVVAIETEGLPATRKLTGLNDEPLKGKRQGQRSVRLNKAYRVIYQEEKSGTLTIVEVLEVNKHEY